MNKIIYLDMDGVVADLDSAFELWAGYHPEKHPDRTAFFDDFLPEYTNQDGFYKQPPMPLANELVSLLKNLAIQDNIKLSFLTSIGHFVHPNGPVLEQKKRWIHKNFPELNLIPMCATSSGKDKSIFANKNTFLIDDHPSNIEHFIKNGGNGFIYREEEFEVLKEELFNFVNNKESN